jgi:mRNA-degrading endonuclease RelE of RelBE toxin-antitoxin system
MSYIIQYEKRALKELSKLSSVAVKQILAKIDSLAIDPYQSGIKKLKGFDKVFADLKETYDIRVQKTC